MDAPKAGVWNRPEVTVPVLSSVAVAALLIGLELQAIVAGQGGSFGIIIIVLGALFLLTAALVWKGRRSGYVVGIVLSVIFLFLLLSFTPGGGFASFADSSTFVTSIIATPAFILIIVYSGLGLMSRRKGSAPGKPARMMPTSSVLALVTLGFVIGGALIGVLAGGVISGLVAGSNTKADVTIVVGASNNGVAQPFSPGNFTVKVGTTVTWVNKDPVAHTVTSSSVPSGAATFDSGVILYGYTYSMKFSQAGVYHYYCTIHPSMTGIIIVTQ